MFVITNFLFHKGGSMEGMYGKENDQRHGSDVYFL